VSYAPVMRENGGDAGDSNPDSREGFPVNRHDRLGDVPGEG